MFFPFYFYLKPTNVKLWWDGSNNTQLTRSSGRWLTDRWYHLVVTVDRSESDGFKVYENGNTTPIMSGDPSSHSSIDVGNNSNAWTFHEPDPRGAEAGQFSLADFRIFKGTALTTANVTKLYNSGLNPATVVNANGDAMYASADGSVADVVAPTTWWKLGCTFNSGQGGTAPALDLQDYDKDGVRSGGLTLTNTGGIKAGTAFMTKGSGAFSIADAGDVTPLEFRNARINMNSATNVNINKNSIMAGKVVFD